MQGVYCIVASLCSDIDLTVGALGTHVFPCGVYVYVGSAVRGIEQRVARHRSSSKRLRWHIDYLLERADVLSVIALPSTDRALECSVARAILGCEGACAVVEGFGSSDCSCRTHLIYLGNVEPQSALESLYRQLALLASVYPRTIRRAPSRRVRQG